MQAREFRGSPTSGGIPTDLTSFSSCQDCVQKLKDKLVEAAAVYRKDKETLDWHVMQDPKASFSFRSQSPLTFT